MGLKTYKKEERIRSKKDFEILFKKGKSITHFPIKLQFTSVENHSSQKAFLFAAAVPKRNFKRAVDRNYIKRQIREGIRKNKVLFSEKLLKSPGRTNLLLINFVSSERATSESVEKAISTVFLRYLNTQ